MLALWPYEDLTPIDLSTSEFTENVPLLMFLSFLVATDLIDFIW